MVSKKDIDKKFKKTRSVMNGICPKCGTKNEKHADFCQECGTNLKQYKIGKNSKSTSTYGIFKWWDKQSRKTQGICIIGVLIGLVLISGLVGSLTHNNLTKIGITGVIADDAGKSHVIIGNETTEYVFHGNPEANATITVSSEKLNITKQKVELDANNSFTYKVNIPVDVSQVNVTFEGTKEGKEDSILVVTIQRPSSTTTSPSTTTPSTTVESESDYKASCKSLSFKELEKNPDGHAGERVKFTGTVVQIMESGGATDIRMDVNDEFGDTIYVSYDKTTSALEDSTITVYGEVIGDYTYTSQANYRITLPWIEAKYIDVG
ncbi:zinc ribbon domain-containing protein [Methanobacterium ferruginis]|uniref:zinc ribbon domain-containing protein n=1 Tax=Methanobacterium ferruginis TaxID=710191 RepID=UPI0025748429|nr:zinc ribbon domain-containing protein [Methanobacterium ferruginis]BDZ67380.1 hypothetical protein GCM10025860_08280 [Methanobacterium ferruginis]